MTIIRTTFECIEDWINDSTHKTTYMSFQYVSDDGSVCIDTINGKLYDTREEYNAMIIHIIETCNECTIFKYTFENEDVDEVVGKLNEMIDDNEPAIENLQLQAKLETQISFESQTNLELRNKEMHKLINELERIK